MKNWRPLKENDLVDIVAPGFACSREDLQNGVRFLESWGLRARVPKNIFGRHHLSANSLEARVQQLKNALLAEDSQAVWCLRGGYGSISLIPELLKVKAPRKPKLFVGLSDISTLHLLLNQKWKWPTLHGPLLDRLGKGQTLPRFERELKKIIFGQETEIAFRGLKALNSPAKMKRTLRGEVSGGNLTVLQSSLSTSLHWRTSGKILFFEDLGERGYRIDRILEQFSQSGLFQSCQAVIFGDLTGGNEPDGSNKIANVLREFAGAQKIPVLKGLQSGHAQIQRPVPFGSASVLWLESGRGDLLCTSGVRT